jgi:tetratricopeptide (TPR) repeat protein
MAGQDEPSKPLMEFLANRKALLVDPIQASRANIRKIMSTFGMKGHNIDIAESFEEAKAKISSAPPHIIFADYVLGNYCGLDLLQMQRSSYPSRLETAFFLLSDKNSPTIAGRVAEEEADALIARPFTFASLKDKIIEGLDPKSLPSSYMRAIDTGRMLLDEGKPDQALPAFSQAVSLDPAPALAKYFMGMAQRQLGNLDQAKNEFEEGLHYNPNHYRCLSALFDLALESKNFEQAYAMAAQLSANFPVTPKRLTDFVRVSVVSHKFEDILSFYEVFSKMEESDETVVTAVAAGLVVCGRYFLQHDKKPDALTALKKAHSVCKGKPKIMRQILRTYIDMGLAAETNAALLQLPADVRSTPEFRVLEFETLNLTGTASEVLQMGMGLLTQKVKDPKVYEIVILRSIEIKRKREAIQELIHEAMQAFPERKKTYDDLEKMLS